MTANELIKAAEQYTTIILICFIALPLIGWIIGIVHPRGKGGRAPWKYFYSLLVYLSCVPGILSAVLICYSLFFIRQNLLEANLIVYFLPLGSMVTTLMLIKKSVNFEQIPGFDRLSGLMITIAVTFILVLGIQKTRIWLFFGASIDRLLILVLGLFVLLKWGVYMLFRSKGQARLKPPSFPR